MERTEAKAICHKDKTVSYRLNGSWHRNVTTIPDLDFQSLPKQLQMRVARHLDRIYAWEFNNDIVPTGNWNTAKDWFPTFEINQETRAVTVNTFDSLGYQKKASVNTGQIDIEYSEDGKALYVRGVVECTNWMNRKCSGTQEFCFAVFVGDSNHIYVHRAPATRGWMEADADDILKRLRKLGIGADSNVIQQGDYLLKPANGNELDDSEFKHEYQGSGHHRFEEPVLRAWSRAGTQVKLTHPVKLHHFATDGIQHPTVEVPAGKWIVGTTAASLRHSNYRD